jgi:predicted CXXCH cytochrome family protein
LTALVALVLWAASGDGAFAQEGAKPGGKGEPFVSPTCAKECHQEITQRKGLHRAAQESCESCHVVTDQEKHTFSLVTKTREELCKKCHSLPHQNVAHPPVRDGKCYECHDPHGSEYPHLLVADPRRELCTRCHSQTVGQAKHVHGPVAFGACVICHKPHGSSEPKLLSVDSKTLCLSCHPEVEAKTGSHGHKALEEGCTRCHDAHASNHPYQLHELAPKLCLQCHQQKFDAMTKNAKVLHGAVTVEGGCSRCHAAHSSTLPALQRGTQPGICLDCHNKPTQTPDGTDLADMAALLKNNPNHHGPIREGACTSCHSPHAGDHFRLLIQDYTPDFYAPFKLENFQLCFTCHIPDLVLKQTGRGLTQFRNGDTNLHYLHVNQQKGRTCRACHEVHASKRPAHIREAVPFGSSGWMLEINFRADEQGGSCSPGCHTPKTYVRGDSVKPTVLKADSPVKGSDSTP